jgi:hypothetical protein
VTIIHVSTLAVCLVVRACVRGECVVWEGMRLFMCVYQYTYLCVFCGTVLYSACVRLVAAYKAFH